MRVTPTTLAALRALKDRRAFADTAALKPAPERLIISDEHGEPLHPHFVNSDFAKITKRASLRPIRLHQLRHTAASLMLLAGVPVKVASQRLGHSTVAVTLNIYSHVAPELDDSAAMAMERVLG